jgi:UDP-glucuronate 4-epimerase
MKVLVTGAAGFIGNEVSKRLLERGDTVYGLDNLNDYYDVNLKQARLERLSKHKNFYFEKIDISDRGELGAFFSKASPDKVVHLAAQAGVRYSLENPHAYLQANVTGLLNVLESCRNKSPDHLIFASSSSVYGLNPATKPFSTHEGVDHPVSLYAATKRSGELMAHSYSQLFSLPITCLRFFTVYGPWGRPDMALFKFTDKILKGQPIEVYNHGNHRRDFTFIDDIVKGITLVLDGKRPEKSASKILDPSNSSAPFRVYNIGNGKSVELRHYIEVLEKNLGMKAIQNFVEAQGGDVDATWADVTDLKKDFGYSAETSVEVGIEKFVRWYRDYYRI